MAIKSSQNMEFFFKYANAAAKVKDAATLDQIISAVRKADDSAYTLCCIAKVYGIAGERHEQRKAFEDAVQKNPNYLDAYVNLANWHFDEKEYGKAKEYAEKAQKIDSNDYGVKNLLGNISNAMGGKDEKK